MSARFRSVPDGQGASCLCTRCRMIYRRARRWPPEMGKPSLMLTIFSRSTTQHRRVIGPGVTYQESHSIVLAGRLRKNGTKSLVVALREKELLGEKARRSARTTENRLVEAVRRP